MKSWLFLMLAIPATAQTREEILSAVARVHGAAGVFAVAGYREGQRALRELGSALTVTHRCPLQVQYSCVADGWQAATGVSAGKLTLRVEESERLETEVRDRKSGRSLLFRLQPTFVERYLNLPYAEQTKAAREVLELPEDQIFQVLPTNPE